MDKSKPHCICCGRGGMVRKCTGCYKVAYCSKDCQKKDWTEGHRDTCTNRTHPKASTPSDPKGDPIHKRQTAAESKIYTTEKKLFDMSSSHASPVHTANTANESDQSADDKSLGNAEAPKSLISTSSPDVQKRDEKEELAKICFTCKSRVTVKFCSRCKETHYCSRECQRSDWGRHKLVCKEVEEKIETEGFKRHQTEANAARDDVIGSDWSTPSRFGFYPFPSPGMFTGTSESTRSRPTRSFGEVKTIVQRMYPLQQIIDDFDELPSDFVFGPPPPTNRVLLAFMTRFYPHLLGRRAMFIQDKKGNETYCIFYLKIPIPFPFFSWDDIRPGWYICIEEAFIHGFFDGTVGIRIEDPSSVRVLKI